MQSRLDDLADLLIRILERDQREKLARRKAAPAESGPRLARARKRSPVVAAKARKGAA